MLFTSNLLSAPTLFVTIWSKIFVSTCESNAFTTILKHIYEHSLFVCLFRAENETATQCTARKRGKAGKTTSVQSEGATSLGHQNAVTEHKIELTQEDLIITKSRITLHMYCATWLRRRFVVVFESSDSWDTQWGYAESECVATRNLIYKKTTI
jgi:hypothetical protein